MPGLNQVIPRPDARELLPPLLACLMTASTSKEAPPGLLPLLSPILRQRVKLLSSPEWLSLLCWDQKIGSKLPQTVEKMHVEPHPVSGEIEAEEPDQIQYRRSDSETLHSRLVLGEFGIIPVYLWCTGGEDGNNWLLSELRRTGDLEDGTEWFMSMSEADEAGLRQTKAVPDQHPVLQVEPAKEEDDDDAYWAAYDRTPSQTPGQKRSPAPMTTGGTQVGPTQSELEYFARYASEVQPALDAHDPDEESAATMHQSTLDGNALNYSREPQTEALETTSPRSHSHNAANDGPEHIEFIEPERETALNHPRPSSSASSNSVERLEREAENSSQAELAIKQHISTDIKSLFRLARASGIDREEFERIVRRELDVLPMLEEAMSS